MAYPTSSPNTKTLRSISSAILAIVSFALICSAQNSGSPTAPRSSSSSQVKIRWVNLRNVPANSGEKMYAEYCSSCHGVAAKGDGPAVPALKVKPADLTTIQNRNKGEFPRGRLRMILMDASNLPSGESAEMPSWCPGFRQLDKYDPPLTALRVRNLLTYLETLQVHDANTAH